MSGSVILVFVEVGDGGYVDRYDFDFVCTSEDADRIGVIEELEDRDSTQTLGH